MDKTIEEFDFENRIIKSSDILEDENFDQRSLPTGIAGLPFSDKLKERLYSYEYNIVRDSENGGCIFIGCPDRVLMDIIPAFENQLHIKSRIIDFKAMTFEKDFDVAKVFIETSGAANLVVLKNIQQIKPSFNRMLDSAVVNNKISFGKSKYNDPINLDLSLFTFIIVCDNKNEIPIDYYERVCTVIDFTEFKDEIRRATAITTFAKHHLKATEEVLNQLSQLNVSDQDFAMRLVEIRNKAFEANVTEITESLLLGSKKSLPEIDVVNQMDGREFELFTGDLFRALGYTNVNVTPASGDFGADVIAEKDDVKFAIQCKRYSAPVGVAAVQEVLASKSLHDCHVACILTNNAFTHAAEALAKKNLVILWGGDKLQKFINRAKA